MESKRKVFVLAKNVVHFEFYENVRGKTDPNKPEMRNPEIMCLNQGRKYVGEQGQKNKGKGSAR